MPNPFAEGGLFRDPQQMQALAGNPMFNMGMGLLAAGQDASINPFSAAMGGLTQAGTQQRLMDKEARDQSLREALAAYFAQQQQPGQPMPTSRVDLMGLGANVPGQAGPGQNPMADFYRTGWQQALNR